MTIRATTQVRHYQHSIADLLHVTCCPLRFHTEAVLGKGGNSSKEVNCLYGGQPNCIDLVLNQHIWAGRTQPVSTGSGSHEVLLAFST
jgi:hypothetical protein